MHGSFTFFLPPLSSGGRSELIDVLVNEKHHDFQDRDDLFPSAKDNTIGVDRRAVSTIVLPTYIKPFARNRTTMKMWHEAAEAIKDASVVSIIGYSFPEPDQMMGFLVSYSDANEFFEKDNRKLKINILNNKEAIPGIRENITKNLRANRNYHINWDEFVLDSKNLSQAYENLVKSLNGQLHGYQ